jgi:hypothetical protein
LILAISSQVSLSGVTSLRSRIERSFGAASLDLQAQTANSLKRHKDAKGEERENNDEFDERLASAGRIIHL